LRLSHRHRREGTPSRINRRYATGTSSAWRTLSLPSCPNIWPLRN
jgi:hypothetical protein